MLSASLLLICGLVFLLAFSIGGGVLLLIKFGVIASHATRPAIEDRGSYSLDQGREVRSEQER